MRPASYFVERAFSSSRIKPDEEDLQAVDLETGVELLNDMLASWEPKLKMGFARVSNQSEMIRVPEHSYLAIYSNLAVFLCGEYGIPATEELVIRARNSKTDLFLALLSMEGVSYPSNLPTGSGNRQRNGRFTNDTFFPENPETNF